MSAGSPGSTLTLYRHILKAAKFFPSKKRDSIIREIKSEFRANKDLADPTRLSQCLTLAQRGLADLRSYLPEARGDAGGGGDIQISLRGATTE
ncbi:hypothetical protein HYH03_001481 [Edaphochlamys debaryana]|uniref:Complex 1 LYR protein domain-containing protein n=1 Tax=Edaphochlamys debaryana TaxID=47281 RepID=A0A835YDR1_9CHLO|nr:hypothetical protein HYH03_001481 [Edaphochlamys debaryana]|eukprot:KAG2500716.1 hypothetical protein HYH03_001481 [Edaphochlamys debaryana]